MPLYLWITEFFGNISRENFLRAGQKMLQILSAAFCTHSDQPKFFGTGWDCLFSLIVKKIHGQILAPQLLYSCPLLNEIFSTVCYTISQIFFGTDWDCAKHFSNGVAKIVFIRTTDAPNLVNCVCIHTNNRLCCTGVFSKSYFHGALYLTAGFHARLSLKVLKYRGEHCFKCIPEYALQDICISWIMLVTWMYRERPCSVRELASLLWFVLRGHPAFPLVLPTMQSILSSTVSNSHDGVFAHIPRNAPFLNTIFKSSTTMVKLGFATRSEMMHRG